MSIYQERQVGNYCRCHAINNLIGKKLVTIPEFNKYCDSFDVLQKFEKGSSRNKYFFYNNGLIDNIFGYILAQKGIHIKMEHYDFYKSKRIKPHTNLTIGYIVYNANHTYCVRYINNTPYLIDSMRSKPQKLPNVNILNRKGVGVIAITH